MKYTLINECEHRMVTKKNNSIRINLKKLYETVNKMRKNFQKGNYKSLRWLQVKKINLFFNILNHASALMQSPN